MPEILKNIFKALNDYGEFAENMPGLADDVEKSVAQVGLLKYINILREKRGALPILARDVNIAEKTTANKDLPTTHSSGSVSKKPSV